MSVTVQFGPHSGGGVSVSSVAATKGGAYLELLNKAKASTSDEPMLMDAANKFFKLLEAENTLKFQQYVKKQPEISWYAVSISNADAVYGMPKMSYAKAKFTYETKFDDGEVEGIATAGSDFIVKGACGEAYTITDANMKKLYEAFDGTAQTLKVGESVKAGRSPDQVRSMALFDNILGTSHNANGILTKNAMYFSTKYGVSKCEDGDYIQKSPTGTNAFSRVKKTAFDSDTGFVLYLGTE